MTTSAIRTDRVFMQHEVAPALDSPLLRQLCEFWTQLNASSEVRETVRSWAKPDSPLAGLNSPGEIYDAIDAAPKPVKDEILRELLGLFHNGEQLAGQVLLHTMLPLLSEMPRSIRTPRGESAYEEALQRVLAEFWEVIAHPREITRPGVAGRLQLDTLHRVTAHRRSSDVWEEHVSYAESLGDEEHSPVATCMAGDAAAVSTSTNTVDSLLDVGENGGLLEVLVWSRDSGTFSADEAQFLGQVYLVHHGDQRAASEHLGLSFAATRQRVTRLRNRLSTAITAAVNAEVRDLALAS